MAPTVSVVLPTHNRRPLLPEAVESVLAQTGPTLELLIVDDGSTDDTPAYLAELAGRDIRTLTVPKRSGYGAACNVGLAQVRGSLVMFMDDDDLLWPDALTTLSTALQREPKAVAAVGARWDWFTQEGYQRRDAHPRIARTRSVFDELLFGWSAVSGQCLYRTSILQQIGGFRRDLPRCEDREHWQRIARHGPVALRPEIVMTYRWHPGQSQLPTIRALRESVARTAIRALPRRDRRRALLIRKSTWWFDAAQDALGEGRYGDAMVATARSVAASPALFVSPLIWPLFVRRLAGRLWHRLRGR